MQGKLANNSFFIQMFRGGVQKFEITILFAHSYTRENLEFFHELRVNSSISIQIDLKLD